ncbi:MAG: hypothetical protein JWL69_1575 [Phycisphaerales bacterium]|jgi:Family of unknown function (DUF6065)|nr:hypothetical protein [Phycisphaerales bacterium]MDB5356579.1 hypothetical protein [Phycisphaerales bacterium]
MCRIEFHNEKSGLELTPHPYPASRHVSDWFKDMPMSYPEGSTIKRCPPFLAAMTAGYIIPAPADLRFEMSAEGVLSAHGKIGFLGHHAQKQYAGSPFGKHTVVKFHNPWIIVTPPEYVCLVTGPINRFELPFLPLSGLIETGTYYKEVHFPMACLMRPGQTYELKAGTPLVQIIPFRREEWTNDTAEIDLTRRNAQQAMFETNPHTYKDEFWQKMTFE